MAELNHIEDLFQQKWFYDLQILLYLSNATDLAAWIR